MRRLLVYLLVWLTAVAPVRAQFAPDNDGIRNANTFRLFATDFETFKESIGGCGVDKSSHESGGLLVTAQASPDMTVHVAAGVLRCNGATASIDADDLTVAAADSSRLRMDIVTADFGAETVQIVQGTASVNPVVPDVPSGEYMIARIMVTPGALTVTEDMVLDKRLKVTSSGGGAGLPTAVWVDDYGAVGDDVAEDSDDWQEAIDDALATPGTWVMGSCGKTYRFQSAQVVIGTTSAGVDSFVNVLGCGPLGTVVHWHGATNSGPFRMARNKYSTFAGIGIDNESAVGTTIGLELGGNTATYGGTQSLSNEIYGVNVTGFDIGIAFGGHNGAASENEMRRVGFYGNDTGFTNTDGNSLNNNGFMLSCGSNGVCGAGGAGGLMVVGGSGSLQTIADFTCNQTHGSCTVMNWRSEIGDRFFLADGSALAITLIGNESSSMDDDIAVELKGAAVNATLIGNRFQDQVALNAYYQGSLTMTNNLVVTSTAYPFEVIGTGGDIPVNIALDLRGNYDFVNSGSRLQLDDVQGVLMRTWTGPCCPGTYAWTVTATNRLNRDETHTGTPFRAGLELTNIRSITQGDAVRRKNMSMHVSFASSGTTQVDFQRNVTVDAPSNPFTAVTVTAGDLTIGDIGRRLTIAGGADYTAYIGTISGRSSSTSFTLRALHNDWGECGACSTVTAVVGEDEDDANYLIEFSCNANENFWWSAKATTGFQMNSSNSSSTAECDVFIH